eukprot:2738155-Prymnesium_polylepis.1
MLFAQPIELRTQAADRSCLACCASQAIVQEPVYVDEHVLDVSRRWQAGVSAIRAEPRGEPMHAHANLPKHRRLTGARSSLFANRSADEDDGEGLSQSARHAMQA